MMKLHSPQLVSLSEASLLHALMSETRRPNLLVVCRRVTVEAAVRQRRRTASRRITWCRCRGSWT